MRYHSKKTDRLYHDCERTGIKLKRVLALFVFVACVFSFVTGCTININIDTSSVHKGDTASNMRGYQSRATILITSKVTAEAPSISSSDLIISESIVDTCETILQSDSIQNEIREEYPNVEYELTLEPIDETAVFVITAVGPEPKHLEEICNMAVSLLCEKLPTLLAGTSCKVIDYASSARLVK